MSQRLAKKNRQLRKREAATDSEKLLGEARAERDSALYKANREFEDRRKEIEQARNDTRRVAWEKYEETRSAIIKQAASQNG